MTSDDAVATNPLIPEWTGPHGLPPFEAIAAEHFKPAFDAALAAQRAEIDRIAADPAAPTFANTIAALERAGALAEARRRRVLQPRGRAYQRRACRRSSARWRRSSPSTATRSS